MKTISIELFRGASPETIDAMLMELFKNYEEITITELECTYGSYLESIKALKEEQTIICYGVLAALKGLSEQGCNGPVTEAINKIEKHLNVQAHK